MTDNALGLLGLARRGGNLAMGEEPVSEACTLKKTRVVLLAADAGDTTRRRAARMAENGGAPLMELPWTKEEVGGQLGRASCALLAVTDQGLAAAFAQRMAQRDESLRPIAEALTAKNERRLSRRNKKTRADDKPAKR